MDDVILEVRHLSHRFKLTRKLAVQALDDLSFQVRRGEIFGLVGESGSGKSTVARCVMNLYQPTSGEIWFNGVNITDRNQRRKHKKMLETKRQLIFQDSGSSMNQRMKVVDVITEPMRIHHIQTPRKTPREEAAFQLKYVGLDGSYLDQYPAELSGGQRQRVNIARALSMEPELLVADEPVAALDVSIQAQIINLFRHLQEEHGFSILFIAHDLAMVEYLCDRVVVLYRGKLVECAPTKALFTNPTHPNTQALLSALPIPDPRLARAQAAASAEEREYVLGERMREVAPDHFVLEGGTS